MKKNPIKTYSFWFKIVGAAFLIAFGLWIIFDKTMAVTMVLLLTGLVAGIFSIIKFIPLMKTLKTGRARLVTIGEILIHLGIAVALVYGGFNNMLAEKNDAEISGIASFIINNYRFIIALFLVTRVISYLWCTILLEEKTDKTKFWVHILLIVLSCVICGSTKIETHIIAIVIAVIALICSLGLIVDAAVGYGRYRKSIAKPEEKKKEEEKTDEISKDAPTEQIIIPVEDEPNDSAIVN